MPYMPVHSSRNILQVGTVGNALTHTSIGDLLRLVLVMAMDSPIQPHFVALAPSKALLWAST